MNYEIVELEEKIVVGVGEELNNNTEMIKKFCKIWDKIYQTDINKNIKNKIDEKAIGIYSDYSFTKPDFSDLKFTFIAGNEVSKSENPEYITKIIPAGKYAKFLVEGNMDTAVQKAWQDIHNVGLNRNFICDFEHYLNSDLENAKIDIYIGIK